ncbi:MAG: hypothetical protein QW757_01295 [Candidatus Woesearchaeota archaeon]
MYGAYRFHNFYTSIFNLFSTEPFELTRNVLFYGLPMALIALANFFVLKDGLSRLYEAYNLLFKKIETLEGYAYRKKRFIKFPTEFDLIRGKRVIPVEYSNLFSLAKDPNYKDWVFLNGVVITGWDIQEKTSTTFIETRVGNQIISQDIESTTYYATFYASFNGFPINLYIETEDDDFLNSLKKKKNKPLWVLGIPYVEKSEEGDNEYFIELEVFYTDISKGKK